jgi:hypothetical protein
MSNERYSKGTLHDGRVFRSQGEANIAILPTNHLR